MKNIFIDLLAFGTLFSSVLVITSKNPVIAVTFLIAVFVNAAGYLILIGVGFIGISYIIVYIGAIVVLFLFVIMMINIKLTDILESGSQYTKNIPLAIAVSGLFLYEIYNVLPFTILNGNNDILDLLLSLNDSIISLLPLGTHGNLSLLTDYSANFSYNQLDHFFIIGHKGTLLNDLILSVPNWADTIVVNYTQIIGVAYSLYTYGAFWFLITGFVLLFAMVAPIYLSLTKNIY